MTVRRLSTDSPWTIRRTISGLIQAVAHSYFLATNNSKRLKTVANFSKVEIGKALQFLAFQAIPQWLITVKMPLVRMRSPVRIRVAAPENPATVAVAGFFVYQRPRKNHDAGQGSPVRRRFAYVRFQPPKPMHGVRPPPFGGGLRFPCRGKSICESLPKPSVSDAFDRLSERACKPGSVIDSHLSRRTVADAFQPPPWDGRAGHMSLRGVAPDRVYSAALSPAGE